MTCLSNPLLPAETADAPAAGRPEAAGHPQEADPGPAAEAADPADGRAGRGQQDGAGGGAAGRSAGEAVRHREEHDGGRGEAADGQAAAEGGGGGRGAGAGWHQPHTRPATTAWNPGERRRSCLGVMTFSQYD